MKITKELLTRLEGEAELKLFWENGKIKDAYVCIPSYRGFEEILKGKPFLDALVINPRVCGICGHAHLRATVEAIEDAYRKEGIDVYITEKAKILRDVTLSLEIVQNHVRWFFLYFMPDILKLEKSIKEDFMPFKGRLWKKAVEVSNLATKGIAVFAGQWPHSSYMFPGGVTCDPMETDISNVISLTEGIIRFFEEEIAEMKGEDYLKLNGKELLKRAGGILKKFIDISFKHGLDSIGKSYGRFLTGGSIHPCIHSGVKMRKLCRFYVEYVHEDDSFSFLSDKGKGYTWAKAVRYRGLPFETGPLARQVVSRNQRILNLFKEFGDSVMVRVLARIEEILILSLSVLEKLKKLDISQDSWIKPEVDIKNFSGEGTGVVEAARGTLIHRIKIKNGRIENYDIITPTVWNLGPRDYNFLGVAEKAITGLESELLARIVLRSFDVCSVCTSH